MGRSREPAASGLQSFGELAAFTGLVFEDQVTQRLKRCRASWTGRAGDPLYRRWPRLTDCLSALAILCWKGRVQPSGLYRTCSCTHAGLELKAAQELNVVFYRKGEGQPLSCPRVFLKMKGKDEDRMTVTLEQARIIDRRNGLKRARAGV